MINRLSMVTTAVLAASAGVQAAEGFDVKFSGFGTVALTHASDKRADYVGTRFQPNGAGLAGNPSFGPDTKLGGQVSAHLNDQWSAVVQVVSQHQYDNSYNPELEWANVKYQVTPELSVRAGRIALPTYLISDSRFVGYANPWAHVPIEVYSVMSITSNDGVDVTHRKAFGDVNNTFQAYYGTSRAKLPADTSVKALPAWGFNDAIELGALTLRAGYSSMNLDVKAPGLEQLLAGFTQLAAGTANVPLASFQATSAQSSAMATKYQLKDLALSAVTLGVNYDPGNWFVMSEFVSFRGEGIVTGSKSWYTTAGYRWGAFTPFVTYARTKTKLPTESGITSVTGDPTTDGAATALTGGINTTLTASDSSQTSTSVGVRWDVMRNTAIKAQYDHVKLGSGSSGRFANALATFPKGGSVDLLSLSLDFVF